MIPCFIYKYTKKQFHSRRRRLRHCRWICGPHANLNTHIPLTTTTTTTKVKNIRSTLLFWIVEEKKKWFKFIHANSLLISMILFFCCREHTVFSFSFSFLFNLILCLYFFTNHNTFSRFNYANLSFLFFVIFCLFIYFFNFIWEGLTHSLTLCDSLFEIIQIDCIYSRFLGQIIILININIDKYWFKSSTFKMF